jgi:uncharacterized DUF497 family protein
MWPGCWPGVSPPELDFFVYCGYNKYEDHVRSGEAGRDAESASIDFAEADEVFAGPTFDQVDGRYDYGEVRVITAGYLRSRMMIVVWTPRGDGRHIISMRKANDREQKAYGGQISENRQRHEKG